MKELTEKLDTEPKSETQYEEILAYLKDLNSLKDRLDHLSRNQQRRVIDFIEYRFYLKGEYLFKKNDIGDVAYVLLFGKVIFLDYVSRTYMAGKEDPEMPSPDKKLMRESIVKDGNMITVEQEFKMPFSAGPGAIIGEQSLIFKDKNKRSLSAMAKEDCVFLILNKNVFSLLVGVSLSRCLIKFFVGKIEIRESSFGFIFNG